MDTPTTAWRAEDHLVDGRAVVVRAVTPADRAALRDGFARLSPDSVYFRFLGARRVLTEQELDFLVSPDFDRHVAIGAELVQGGTTVPVGVARYVRGDAPDVAEFAVAVDEGYHRLGVGTLLLRHLAAIARAKGVARLEGTVLAGNHEMLEVIAHLATYAGIAHRQRVDNDTVSVVLDLNTGTCPLPTR